MKPLLLSALVTIALAPSAFAEAVVLKAPLQAGSLHTGSLDMVAYRQDLADGAFEVTAAFHPGGRAGKPQLIKMRLEDQDQVRFSMPNEPRTLYTFARIDDVVQVSAERLPAPAVAAH